MGDMHGWRARGSLSSGRGKRKWVHIANPGEELIEREWYDVRTFRKEQRQEMTSPGYLLELLQRGHVTAAEMHSHTLRSDGVIEPERIGAWTHALDQEGYFRHEHEPRRA